VEAEADEGAGIAEAERMAIRMIASVLWAVGSRTWKKTFRRPVVLVFSLIQPLMWMLFFGFLFHRYALDAEPGSPTYLQFLMPGVCVMTVLFGASQSGSALIRDMQSGFLGRMLRTPAPGAAIMGGKVLADTLRLLCQAAVVCLLGMALGARIQPQLPSLLWALGYLSLFAMAYSALSNWIALATRSQETMGVFIQAVNMPLLFTSTVLVPDRQMPEWLAQMAAWNPLSSVASVARGALLRGEAILGVGEILAMGGAAVVLFAGATVALDRNRKD
jgi:ABC-2 type transport system permease protein